MTAVYRKELKSYFCGMTGAIFIGFVLLFTGIFTVVNNFKGYYPDFEYTVSAVSFIYLLVIPIITMRSVAEEKRAKTDKLLYSLPMSMGEIVCAKYFAMLTVLLIPTVVMSLYPLIMSSYGIVNFSAAYAMIFAFFLLGATLISIGMFIYSLTESQVIAAVASLGVMILDYFMTGIANLIPMSAAASLAGVIGLIVVLGLIVNVMVKNQLIAICASAILCGAAVLVYIFAPSILEGLIPNFLSSVSAFDKLTSFRSGIFDLTAVVYYLSVSALFVFLTVQSMEKKRWN